MKKTTHTYITSCSHISSWGYEKFSDWLFITKAGMMQSSPTKLKWQETKVSLISTESQHNTRQLQSHCSLMMTDNRPCKSLLLQLHHSLQQTQQTTLATLISMFLIHQLQHDIAQTQDDWIGQSVAHSVGQLVTQSISDISLLHLTIKSRKQWSLGYPAVSVSLILCWILKVLDK